MLPRRSPLLISTATTVAAALLAQIGAGEAGTRDGRVDCELLVPGASWRYDYSRESNRLRAEIDLPEPVEGSIRMIRCIFAGDGQDLHFVVGRRTGICHLPGLALPFKTAIEESLGPDGKPTIEAPTLSVRGQDTGHAHPPGGKTFVVDSAGSLPGDQPAFLDNTTYCDGLGDRPGSPFAPWGENRCCLEYYDMLWEFTTAEPLSHLAFTTEFSILGLEGFDFGGLIDEFCGDGVRYCDEQCDDGNNEDFDGCSVGCQTEPCGQPRSGGTRDGLPRVVDALHVLNAAVGVASCDPCVCDIDSSGATDAGDAGSLLRGAVGLPLERTCVPCLGSPTITEDRCLSAIWPAPRLGICDDVLGYLPIGEICQPWQGCSACACRPFASAAECEGAVEISIAPRSLP